MIVILVMIILFIILGFVFLSGKGAFLIAGYNTLPKEEQDKFDVTALCRFMGKMMFALSFSMVFWLVADIISSNLLLYFGIGLFLAITIFMVVYANTGERFKK